MFTETHQPRFSETDALGHINNTVVPIWFEAARVPVFQIFIPDQDLTKWNLIIAKVEVNYLAQMGYQAPVEIRTHISKIGNSSFNVLQEVWQNDQRVAWGECVMVKFDYSSNRSAALSDTEKSALTTHFIDKAELL